jgi:Spy/CpxP family protein refolding chaperone
MRRIKAALLAAFTTLAVAGAAHAAVPNPAVQGPIEGGIHNRPWNHSLFSLSGRGYDYT